MAEGDAAASTGKGALDFLKQKVGPLPLGVWLLIGLGVWYYMQRKQSGGAGTSSAANLQTDPAGNVGSIDPATGYVYGTPEDLAALAAQNASSTTSTASAPTTRTYADNNAWGIAAINYLVGLGVDPTQANQAIELYLTSQTLTTQQQADVNQAIQALGPPPDLPGPVSSNPGGVITQPGSSGSSTPTKAYPVNPPTGVTVSNKQPTSLTVKWNRVKNATGYDIQAGETKGSHKHGTSTGPNTLSATIGGLTPGTHYYIQVQAKPAKSGAAWGETQASTTKGTGSAGKVNPGGPNIPAKKK